MLYWFFVKGLGPIAIHRLGPTAQGLENIPREGGAIIAANHLAVIDDALLVNASRVRILHGTGTGALRQAIRQYLHTIPGIASFHDEHVQFGGAGITVVELK